MTLTFHAVRVGGLLSDNIMIVRTYVWPHGKVSVGAFTLAAAPFVQKEFEVDAARHERLADENPTAATASYHRQEAGRLTDIALAILKATEAAQAMATGA